MVLLMAEAFPIMAEERIDLTGLDTRPLRVAQTMLASVLTLIGEALGRPRNGAPREWTGLVRESLGPRDYLALLPVFGREQVLLPDCLTPLPRAGAASPAEAVEEIASTSPDILLDQAAAEFGGEVPRTWAGVEAAPARWLEDFARAIGHASDAIEPVWRGALPLVERETERIGVASAVGASRDVLATLHAVGRVEDDDLVLRRHGGEPSRWVLPEEGLSLVPMLGGTRALVSSHDGDLMTHLAYPVNGQERLLEQPAGREDRLAALLGIRRATVLRLLDRPATAGAVAAALQAVPSAATHHVRALEAAGLVFRERAGQHVRVHRTDRGTALLALYDGG
jgi:DNA-binding transcriptional ArsR family regulator